jgi:Tfp pilus assembly protein PilN
VGLAAGGLASGRRINLMGVEGREALGRRRMLMVAAAVGAVLFVALGGLWYMQKQQVDDQKDDLARVEAENASLQRRISSLSDAQRTQADIDARRGEVDTLLRGDVSWARMLQEISRTIPGDTWLTAFQGSVSSPATAGSSSSSSTGTAAGSGAIGTASFTVVGLDFTSVSAWIQRIGTQVPSFSNLWVPNATKASSTEGAGGVGRELVNFTSNADITEAARSNRGEAFDRETR